MPTAGPVVAAYKAAGGGIYWATCLDGGSGGYVWLPTAPATTPQVTAAMVSAEAKRLVPSAAVGLAPKGTTLVNIQTVMWADAPSKQTLPAVTLLGQHVVITMTLTGVDWTYGDGHSTTNAPAGKPYDGVHDPCRTKQCPHYFGHTYLTTGHVTISAQANWTATFTVNAGAVQTVPNPVPGPPAQAVLAVKQARSVLVPNPGN